VRERRGCRRGEWRTDEERIGVEAQGMRATTQQGGYEDNEEESRCLQKVAVHRKSRQTDRHADGETDKGRRGARETER